MLDELEPLVRRLGDLYRLHWVLFESSFAALAAGNWTVAIAGIESALEVHRRSGYRAHGAWHVAVLGAVARLRGRYDEAVVIGRRAVALSEQAPHVWTAAATGAALGTTLLETGAVDEAVAVLETARAAASQDGAEAILLRCLAPLAEATGSAEILADAAALLGQISTPDGSAFLTADGCYLAVARAWLARGEPDRARAALGAAADGGSAGALGRPAGRRVTGGRPGGPGARPGRRGRHVAAPRGGSRQPSRHARHRRRRGRAGRRQTPRPASRRPGRLAARPARAALSCNETATAGETIAVTGRTPGHRSGRIARPGSGEAGMALDEAKLNEFLGRFVGDLGATIAAGVTS